MTLMKSSFFGLLLLILLSSSSSSSRVSEPGSVVSRTYHYIKSPSTWQDAQTYCRKHFTDLAIIYQDADLDSLSLNHYLFWVRHSTHSTEEQNQMRPTESLSLFSDLEINDRQDIDRCTILDTETNKVSLAGCERFFAFHCQYSSRGKNYTPFHWPSTWKKARETCRKRGDLLASSAKNYTKASIFPVWIGLRREGDDWKWSWGSSDYRRWNHPWHQTRGHCAFIYSKRKTMIGTDCSRHFPFVCVSDNLVLVKEKKTWEEALEHCRTMDSQDHSNAQYDLVSVQPGNNQDDVMMSVRKADMEEVWVGLRFLAGTWLWTTGADMLHTGLPRCPSEWRHCGVLSKNNGSSLEARDCAERKNFLCYRKK